MSPWIEGLSSELDRLVRAGATLKEETRQTLVAFALVLEISEMPRPVMEIRGDDHVWLGWCGVNSRLVLEIRPYQFEIKATDRRFSKASQLEGLRWVDGARKAFAWISPDHARGHHPHHVHKEIEH